MIDCRRSYARSAGSRAEDASGATRNKCPATDIIINFNVLIIVLHYRLFINGERIYKKSALLSFDDRRIDKIKKKTLNKKCILTPVIDSVVH